MAEHEVRKLFAKIQDLRSARPGVEGDHKSEMYRLWVLMDHILQMEGGRTLEEMEDKILATRLCEELSKAKQEILNPEEMEEDSPAEFPHYLDLPGPVVREHILSFLTLEDLLSVMAAIPSEAYLLRRPLAYYKFMRVMEILIRDNKNDDLTDEDVLNFMKAETKFMTELMEELCSKSTDVLFVPPERWDNLDNYPPWVDFNLPQDLEQALDKLQGFGQGVLEGSLRLGQEITPEQFVSCLRLMKNVCKLRIDCYSDLDLNAEVLPKLPFLKELSVGYDESTVESSVTSAFLQKCSGKLEILTLRTDEMPVFGVQAPQQVSSLRTLKLSISRYHRFVYQRNPSTPTVILNGLTQLAHCPLKVLNLEVDVALQPLLILIGRHWGQSLAYLILEPARHASDNGNPTMPSTWMANLQFPNLKRLKIFGYSLLANWSFLALFPALEALDYNGIDGEDGIAHDDGTLIKLYNNRMLMLQSNLWKLFPELGKIMFLSRANDIIRYDTIKRENYIMFQNRNKY